MNKKQINIIFLSKRTYCYALTLFFVISSNPALSFDENTVRKLYSKNSLILISLPLLQYLIPLNKLPGDNYLTISGILKVYNSFLSTTKSHITLSSHIKKHWSYHWNQDFCTGLLQQKNRYDAVGYFLKHKNDSNNSHDEHHQKTLLDLFKQNDSTSIKYINNPSWLYDPDHRKNLLDVITWYPKYNAFYEISDSNQTFSLFGYHAGHLVVPLLEVSKCYFRDNNERFNIILDKWTGLVKDSDGYYAMYSIFQKPDGKSLYSLINDYHKGAISISTINSIFSLLGKNLSLFHKKHMINKDDQNSFLSKSVIRDQPLMKISYSNKSGFSLNNTTGLSVSILEPIETKTDFLSIIEGLYLYEIPQKVINTFIDSYLANCTAEQQVQLNIELKHFDSIRR